MIELTHDRARVALVAIKKVINPNVKLKLTNSNGMHNIDLNSPSIINPYDQAALDAAIQLKTTGGIDTIIVVSIGANNKDLLIQALAKGADRGILITTELSISSLNIAKILQAIILEQQISLALLGKQAIDDECQQTGAMLAGLLDWPQVTAATKIDLSNLPHYLTITKETEQGLTVTNVCLPVVITADLTLADHYDATYVSLPQLLAAKKKPLEIRDLSQYNNLKPSLDLTKIKILTTTLRPLKTAQALNITNIDDLLHTLRIEQVLP